MEMSMRKDINKLAEQEFPTEEKTVSITFDGKQCLARIPKEIAKLKGIKKGDKMQFKYTFPKEGTPQEDGELEIRYVKQNGKR